MRSEVDIFSHDLSKNIGIRRTVFINGMLKSDNQIDKGGNGYGYDKQHTKKKIIG